MKRTRPAVAARANTPGGFIVDKPRKPWEPSDISKRVLLWTLNAPFQRLVLGAKDKDDMTYNIHNVQDVLWPLMEQAYRPARGGLRGDDRVVQDILKDLRLAGFKFNDEDVVALG